MANLALVTNNTSNVAATNMRDALVANGHTVTLIADSAIAATDFSPYDAIVTTRLTYDSRATIAGALRPELDGGKPLLLGLYDTGMSTTGALQQGVTFHMALTGTVRSIAAHVGGNYAYAIEITDDTHAITSPFGIGTLVLHSAATLQAAVDSSQSFAGTKLAGGDNGQTFLRNGTALIAIEAGDPDLNDTPVAARCVVFGGYPGTPFTTDGIDLIGAIMDWLLEAPPAQPTDITATTILEPIATVAIQQEHRIRADTLLELTTALEMETPTEIAAATLLELVADLSLDTRPATDISADTLLELVADLTISTVPAALITAETILEIVAEASIQQEHRVRAETMLELVADLALEAEDAANISATTLLEVVATAEIATAHNVRAETLLELVATAQIAQDHNIRTAALLELVAHEGYTGPGTGIVVPGARFTPNALREGDTFRVVLPWAGISGITGLAHVNSRTLRDDRHEQDVDLHITPLDTPNVPALAGGARPVAGADQQDYARRLSRSERTQDRIERDRR